MHTNTWIKTKDRKPPKHFYKRLLLPSGSEVIGAWTGTRWIGLDGYPLSVEPVSWFDAPGDEGE
jgi:hypothetical protein